MNRTAIDVFRTLIIRMAGRQGGVRGDVTIGVLLEIVALALGLAGPLALKFAIDVLSVSNGRTDSAVMAMSSFVAAWALGTLVGIWRLVYTGRVITAIAASLTSETLNGQLPHAVGAKDGDSGRILGILERLPYSLETVLDGILWRGGPLVAQLALTLGVVGTLIPLRYTVCLAVTSTGFVLLSWQSARRYGLAATGANSAASNVSQLIGDLLRNARRVVLNGATQIEIETVKRTYQAKQAADQVVVWTLLQATSLQFGFLAVGLIALFSMGVYDAGAGRMSVGNFVLLQTLAFRMIAPLSGLGYALSQAGVAISNISDVTHLSAKSHGAPRSSGASGEGPSPGLAALEGVSFCYGPGLAGIDDISFELAAGSYNLVVGANGSGKSTIGQILAGILQPKLGTVAINGLDLSLVPPGQRHEHVLYVPQFIGLFNRSVLENALYPPTRHDEGQLGRILQKLQYHEAGRPVDLGQAVGEQGERLSGGQIQKLELARISGTTTPIIVLDESTSALDRKSEKIAIELLRASDIDRTIVHITHNLASAQNANTIILVDAGRIVAKGDHAWLLESSGHYRDLWLAYDSGRGEAPLTSR